jgi:hypothetical protein
MVWDHAFHEVHVGIAREFNGHILVHLGVDIGEGRSGLAFGRSFRTHVVHVMHALHVMVHALLSEHGSREKEKAQGQSGNGVFHGFGLSGKKLSVSSLVCRLQSGALVKSIHFAFRRQSHSSQFM